MSKPSEIREEPRQAKTVMNSSLAEDSKTLAQSTQKSYSAYGPHRSSVNESSIHNKLSALRNVFS